VTRRYLASLLQRLPVEQRWEVATRLVTDAPAGKDRLLPRLVWYALEPVVEADPARAFDLAGRNAWPELPGFIARRAAISPAGRSALMTFLTRSRNADEFVRRSQQLLGALAQLPPVERPAGWEEARKKGESLGTPAVTDALRRMGVRFGDPAYFPFWRTVAGSGTTPAAQRVKAIELLQAGSDPELGNLARESLAVPALRRAAINGLRNDPGEATATAIVLWIAKFPLKLRNDAINLLATRPDMALVLLRAVDGKKIDAALVSPVLLDQFERFGDERLDALIRRNWSRGATGIDPAEYRVAVSEWKARLNPRTLAGANASRGRAVYDRTCGTCHQLFGEGIALGPDLTGSNRADLGYLLENVLAPSAVVGRDYLLHVFTMNDGTVVSGMVTESTPEFIKVAMPGGSFADVKVSEIREREEMAQSLMPPGLFDTLPLAQVADLVKYLASPNQVPLPGGPKPPATPIGGTPAGAGVVRLEGEALLSSVEASGGNVRAQPMKGFGPHWSGDAQLFWIGGKPSDTLTITLPGVTPGTHDVSIVPTTARDYARIKVLVAGHLATADLYGKSVLPGEPVRFNEVSVSPSEPLRIVITVTGRHPDALPRHMVGIDHIELRRRP
jgi:putative heme-binding domain-containing protein